jgi:transposase-like protein
MSKHRRTFERDRKATILKKYLVDKVSISDLCDEYGIASGARGAAICSF